MRILRVVASLDPRGGGIVSSLMATSQALATRHDVTIMVSGQPSATSPAIAFRDGVMESGRTVSWPSSRAAVEDHDLVLLEGAWNRKSMAIVRACWRVGRPYVYVPHGGLSLLVRREFPLRHAKKLAFWLAVEMRVARRASSIWYASPVEQRLSLGTFPGLSRNSTVVGFAARDVGYSPPRHRAVGEPLRLVTAARLAPVKKLDVLIHALRELPISWELDVAGGGGDSPEGRRLHQIAAEAGVDSRIRWHGFLSSDALDDLYRQAHAYVCPGIESFGMSAAEALSSNLPLIASDGVGVLGFAEGANEVARLGDPDDFRRALIAADEVLRTTGFADAPRQAYLQVCSDTSFLGHFESAFAAHATSQGP